MCTSRSLKFTLLLLKVASGRYFRNQLEYVVLPPTRNVVFSEATGPSTVNLLVSGPIPAVAVTFFELPSLVPTSMIDEILPPSLSGMALLYNSRPRTTSGSTAEKNPKRCVGL